jgi:uncharacterized protein
MLIVLSPAKTLDFSKTKKEYPYSLPIFTKEAAQLIKILKKFKPEDISQLMGISAKLADLNYERFLRWNPDHQPENSKQAVLAFKGDVYEGLQANTLKMDELNYLNKQLRILSGLYGVLLPFDIIREYRLEMGTKLENQKGKDLYQFWGNKISKTIVKAIEESEGEKVLVNLASSEYFKTIDEKNLNYQVITPVFKEFKDGQLQFVSFFAKKARGLMTRFAALEKITKAEDLKFFNHERYHFDTDLSDDRQWVFTR